MRLVRTFDKVNNVISVAAPVVTAFPFTFAAWARSTDPAAGNQTVMSLVDNTADDKHFDLRFAGASVGDPSQLVAQNAGTERTTASSVPVANKWHFIYGRFVGTSDRRFSLDFAPESSSGTSVGFFTPTHFCVGYRNDLTPDSPFGGQIAHVQVWNRDLSIFELQEAARKPGSIQRGLALYWPLWGASPESDYSGFSHPGTVSGATTDNILPPIYTGRNFVTLHGLRYGAEGRRNFVQSDNNLYVGNLNGSLFSPRTRKLLAILGVG